MNREIKFRAWDGRGMILYLTFTMTPEGWIHPFVNYKEGVNDIMQFTGLYDKNGKEIYEGDIVSEGYNRKYGVFTVKWDKCGFNLNTGGDGSFEIIGNIYDTKIPDDYDYNRNVAYD